MRLLVRRLALLTFLLSGAANAFAASSTEFYTSLLDRGVSSFHAERYQEATTYLKLAAFGFVDSIDRYQTAQVYLTLSYDRLGDVEKARDAARRVIAAERIQPKFAGLPLPAGIGSSFDSLVTRLLGSADSAFLRRPAPPQVQPQTPVQQPQPAQQKPQQVAPAPSVTTPAATTPKSPVVEKPAVKQPPPSPAPTTPKTISPQDANALLVAGDRAVASAQLNDARRAYRSLLDAPGVTRETLIRVAEGLYRARDFEGSLLAFAKVGTLRRGEEPYHYYMAVASYETGKYAKAKVEMDAAIPFIEITPDVARYRAKIDASVVD
jgi:tetratricopeptide (TPR) repeat protein